MGEECGIDTFRCVKPANGSLMRTAPVALAYLDDEAGLVAAARKVSELTHYDADAGDACVLWCTAIRHAVLTGQLDVRLGLGPLSMIASASWISPRVRRPGQPLSSSRHRDGTADAP